MNLFNSRPVLLFLILLLATGNSIAQEVIPREEPNGVSVTWKEGKYCKYLFIQHKVSYCNRPVLTYTPLYMCSGKKLSAKKRPTRTFESEMPSIHKMMDSAKVFLVIDLCMFNLNVADYDDLLSRHIDAFAASVEWKKSLENRPLYSFGKLNYDHTLALNIMRNSNIFVQVDKFLYRYGFRIATVHASTLTMNLVPKSELKRLKKDENLVVPLPDPVSLQLSSVPK
jgi:hypothetical protein